MGVFHFSWSAGCCPVGCGRLEWQAPRGDGAGAHRHEGDHQLPRRRGRMEIGASQPGNICKSAPVEPNRGADDCRFGRPQRSPHITVGCKPFPNGHHPQSGFLSGRNATALIQRTCGASRYNLGCGPVRPTEKLSRPSPRVCTPRHARGKVGHHRQRARATGDRD